MDAERIIHDIEQLEEIFEAADIRPLSPSDILLPIEARRKACAQPVVSIVATLWRLLPTRVASAVKAGTGELIQRGLVIVPNVESVVM